MPQLALVSPARHGVEHKTPTSISEEIIHTQKVKQQIRREYNPQLTITNHTELLKDTLLYCFCIVQNYLPRRILILAWHINIEQLFYSSTFDLEARRVDVTRITEVYNIKLSTNKLAKYLADK
ncbi:NADH-quinone oxidoreductase subunit D [Striga asiatica]|uniref:NADH-quinone oxidoreductase subunit D n=1 Tax=Striga asiatica TaxID=4170 RepID=A0A5A7PMA4_STRAF|nr:NADH-quinone oxidoreductase subunit D [Striga asiatica]